MKKLKKKMNLQTKMTENNQNNSKYQAKMGKKLKKVIILNIIKRNSITNQEKINPEDKENKNKIFSKKKFPQITMLKTKRIGCKLKKIIKEKMKKL